MITLPRIKRIHQGFPRCENLSCDQRSGGPGPGSRGVIVEAAEPTTLKWWGAGQRRERTAILCCFCRPQVVGEVEVKIVDR